MKVGDIVVRKYDGWNAARTQSHSGMIVNIFEKKCWRTADLGNQINWEAVEPEPHAEVLIREDLISIPLVDLELLHEGR